MLPVDDASCPKSFAVVQCKPRLWHVVLQGLLPCCLSCWRSCHVVLQVPFTKLSMSKG